eukprot:m.122530 g.122530  ORF g.122530 m.122530 type:complete len:101 (-) comp15548_c0_seq6:1944-2246(-)
MFHSAYVLETVNMRELPCPSTRTVKPLEETVVVSLLHKSLAVKLRLLLKPKSAIQFTSQVIFFGASPTLANNNALVLGSTRSRPQTLVPAPLVVKQPIEF